MRKAGDKNIGFAASDDMRRAWYHPQIKIPVGERIARWALATQYGVNIRWLPPTVKEMKVDGNKIIVTLDTEASAYNSGPIYGFAIAGSDKKFYPAQANYLVDEKKNTIRSVIVLTSPCVAEPVAYRYGWHRNPMGNLKISSCELPLPISRSDSWSLNDLYEAYTGKTVTKMLIFFGDRSNPPATRWACTADPCSVKCLESAKWMSYGKKHSVDTI